MSVTVCVAMRFTVSVPVTVCVAVRLSATVFVVSIRTTALLSSIKAFFVVKPV